MKLTNAGAVKPGDVITYGPFTGPVKRIRHHPHVDDDNGWVTLYVAIKYGDNALMQAEPIGPLRAVERVEVS